MTIKIGDKNVCVFFHNWKIIKEKIGDVTWDASEGESKKTHKCRGVILECSNCKKQKAYIEKTEGKRYPIAPWALDVEVK